MSERDRGDRGALVALGLLLFVVLAGWLFEIGGRHQSCYQVATPANYSENQQYNGQAEYTEVCSTDYQVFGDTIAQWLMALFAIAATLVSWRAVILVRETYKETKRTADAAAAANDINRDMLYASNRPYLELRNATLTHHIDHEGREHWMVAVYVSNRSDFPAIDVSCNVDIRPIPLGVFGNKGTAEFAEAFVADKRNDGTVIVHRMADDDGVKLSSGVFNELPPDGQIAGKALWIAVRYRSSVNPDFYYVAGQYHVMGNIELERAAGGAREGHRGARIIPESIAAT
jgi:hypothetical protein